MAPVSVMSSARQLASPVATLAELLLSQRDPDLASIGSPYETSWSIYALVNEKEMLPRLQPSADWLSKWLEETITKEEYLLERDVVSACFSMYLFDLLGRILPSKTLIESFLERQLRQNPESTWIADIILTSFVILATHKIGTWTAESNRGIQWLKSQDRENRAGDLTRAAMASFSLTECNEREAATRILNWIDSQLEDPQLLRNERLFGLWALAEGYDLLGEDIKRRFVGLYLKYVSPRVSLITDRRESVSPIEIALVLRIVSLFDKQINEESLVVLTKSQRAALLKGSADRYLVATVAFLCSGLWLWFAWITLTPLILALPIANQLSSTILVTVASVLFVWPASLGLYKIRGYQSDPVLKSYMVKATWFVIGSVALSFFIGVLPTLLKKP